MIDIAGIVSDMALESRLRTGAATPADALSLDRAYRAVFKRSIDRTCGNCLHDAWVTLRIQYKNNPEKMKEQIECSYTLKAGVVLRIPDKTGKINYYTNSNLTDAVAGKWLSENPERRNYFASVPGPEAEPETVSAEAAQERPAEEAEAAPEEPAETEHKAADDTAAVSDGKPVSAKKTRKSKKTASK